MFQSKLSSPNVPILWWLVILILSVSLKAVGEELDVPPSEKTPDPETETTTESNYRIAPHIVDKKNLHPLTTGLNLGGIPINHLTELEILSSYNYNFGESITGNFDFTALMTLDLQVEESLTIDNIITIEQTGNYVQLGTIKKRYEVTETVKEPQTLLGFELQLSLLGSCESLGINSDNQCVYTPGLQTDRTSIDPDSLVPTRVIHGSKFGEVVTPESLAVISNPGFQTGANGQSIGFDLFVPNSGGTFGNTQSNQTNVSRIAETSNTPAVMLSRVKQIIRANHEKAVIGRSIRGLGFILDDENALLGLAIQLGTELLPDINPQLPGSEQPINPNINKNLFFAANNNRVPPGSFTSYQIGLGTAITPTSEKIPSAVFHSLWVGVSPVTERSYTSRTRYETISPLATIATAGGEGGGVIGDNVPDTQILIDDVGSFSTNNVANLGQDFHNQTYLSFFNQEVFVFNSTTLNEEVSFHPHFSFTGNITNSDRVVRYYTGAITADEIKAYIGMDWTEFFGKKKLWTSELGAIAYLNPDRDYYSHLWGGGSRRFLFNPKTNLALSMNFHWAWDREKEIGEILLTSPDNFLRVTANLRREKFVYGISYVVGGILPNSLDDNIIINWGVNLRQNLQLSAYYNLVNNTSSNSPYGATLQLALGKNPNRKTLSLVWNYNEYDYGHNAAEQELVIKENNFRLTFSTLF